MPHLTPPPNSQPQARVRKSQYPKAKPLPALLLGHCVDTLEEQLFSQTFSLLSSCLTSGQGSVEAQIPPPRYLALAATLLVHPSLTTRTTSSEKHVAAHDALKYLHHVNSILGPRHSGLDKAFQFESSGNPARGSRARSRVSEAPTDADSDQSEKLRLSYVDKEALWTNAEDFWCVVGWAFNCSVAYPARWARWKLGLSLILDVLEDDLEARLPDATRAYIEYGSTEAVCKVLQDSMLSQYLSPIGEGRNNKRRLMRAVLANGTSNSLAEFPEIWKHETRPPKQKQDVRMSKKRKLDIDNSEFGDYYDHSDNDSPGTSLRPSRSTTARPSRAASDDSDGEGDTNEQLSTPGIETYGGIASLHLRQRILALLTLFSTKNPDAFLDTEDLFDLYTEFLRPLPLLVFQQFVLPAKPWLGPNSQASLNQMLLRPLLAGTAPPYQENALTQSDFEVHYAPFAANSTGAVDNAKVSLLLEGLVRLLWKSGHLVATERLRALVKQGIEARKEKVAWSGQKKVGVKRKVDEEAVVAMNCSAERMLVVLDM